MRPALEKKYRVLTEKIREMRRTLVAFSGGCDSALLAKVCRETLGAADTLAVTSRSGSLPRPEILEIRRFVRRHDLRHQWIETGEMKNRRYVQNPVNRCYFCKTELYEELLPLARKLGFETVVNGAQADDLNDWRPGLRAAEENGVRSPLVEAQFNKADVREMAKALGLETWNKPAAACLSSRIPHGSPVTAGKLRQIDEGEQLLKEAGFSVVRLRHFGNRARIEVGGEELGRLTADERLREKIAERIKKLGFEQVEIDPEGYRQGSLHRLNVPKEEKAVLIR